MKMVIGKLLYRMSAGQQKGFFLMKLNAQKASFDVKMENTIKTSEKKQLLERLTGISN